MEDRAVSEWVVTGRLGELQLEWLKRHYSEEQLDAALAEVVAKGQRGYPLNVARMLQRRGGPQMPPAHELLERDPLAKERAAAAAQKALQRLRRLREGDR